MHLFPNYSFCSNFTLGAVTKEFACNDVVFFKIADGHADQVPRTAGFPMLNTVNRLLCSAKEPSPTNRSVGS